jgi:tight adherence protein B
MNSPMLVAGLAFVIVALAVLLVSSMTLRKQTTVQRRLTSHEVAVATMEAKRQERLNVLKRERYSSVSIIDAILGKLRPARTAVHELTRANSSLGVVSYLMIRVVAGVVASAIVQLVLSNILLALLAFFVGLMLPRMQVRRRGKKRIAAFEAQLAEAIDLLVGSLRAGQGFMQGLDSVSREIDNPMKQELSKVVEQIGVGIPPGDAMQAMSQRVPSYDLSLMVAAVAVQRQTGGNLAEVLENLAATVRERRRIRGEVSALTTGPRVSSYVLGAIPMLLFVYFITISPDYREIMLGTVFGYIMIGMAATLCFLGFFFARKVSKVEY